MSKAIDWSGRVFGRLTVLSKDPFKIGSPTYWRCICQCGGVRSIDPRNLVAGHTKSCGCYKKERTTTHGHAQNHVRSREWMSWSAAKICCLNPKNPNYYCCGGIGITVCDRWLGSFEAFFADMGPKPPGTRFRRLDTTGDFTPENCAWVPIKKKKYGVAG